VNGILYILQTRPAKRTPIAAINIVVAFVKENLITEREALLRINSKQMSYFLHLMINSTIPRKSYVILCCVLSSLFPAFSCFLCWSSWFSVFSLEKEDVVCIHGKAVSYGAAVGKLVFSKERLLEMVKHQQQQEKREFEEDDDNEMKFILCCDDCHLAANDIHELKVR
jgi:phosphoenolpyruvate synthase/pyruvate phosphate dikinase